MVYLGDYVGREQATPAVARVDPNRCDRITQGMTRRNRGDSGDIEVACHKNTKTIVEATDRRNEEVGMRREAPKGAQQNRGWDPVSTEHTTIPLVVVVTVSRLRGLTRPPWRFRGR